MSAEPTKMLSPFGVLQEIDLRKMLSSLYGERWIIIGFTLIFLLCGVFYVKTTRPNYTVDTTIQIEQQSRDVSMSALDSVGSLNASSMITTEMELLKSRMVLGRVVDELNLAVSAEPKTLPILGYYYLSHSASGGWSFLRSRGYPSGNDTLELSNLEVPTALLGTSFTLKILPNKHFEVRHPDGTLEVQGSEGTVAVGKRISVLVANIDAQPGAEFLIKRVPRLAAINMLNTRLLMSEKSFLTGMLQIQMVGPDPALDIRILDTISTVFIEQNRNRKQEDAKSALNFLDTQLPEVKKTLESSENSLTTYQQRSGSLNTGAEANMLMGSLQNAQNNLATERLARDGLLTRFTANHPQVISQDQKIELINRQIAEIRGRISNLPRIQEGTTRISRDLNIKNDLYGNLVSVSQQLKVAKASRIGNVRLIDQAVTPLAPSAPQSGAVIAGSLVAGLTLGFVIALLRIAFRRGIKDAAVIEQTLGLPVYAMVPVISQSGLPGFQTGSKQHHALLINTVPNDPAIESLRSLRTALKFSMLDATGKRILVTGPLPGVGKSFVASNLASVVAQAGQRVLLVDADLRKGRQHELFGQARGIGLSELIVGQTFQADIVMKTGVNGLDLLTTGQLPPNPAELFMSPRLETLLADMEAHYDLIIFDSAPILPVTDTSLLARHMTANLAVIEFDQTTELELINSLKRLEQVGSRFNGVVLNKVTARFDAYGYGQGYRYDSNRP